ncbi:unnamed protein product [Caenorhabditis brenneri]
MTKVTPKALSKTESSSNSNAKHRSNSSSDNSDSPMANSRKSGSRRPADKNSSNIEPPTKKNRADASDRQHGRSYENKRQAVAPESGIEENTRRRRTLKAGEHAAPHCTFCKNPQFTETEPLTECSNCKAQYHLKKCLRYKDELANSLLELETWYCPRCVACKVCNRFVADPQNVECSSCCNTWHGACAPKGYSTSTDFDSPWFCGACARKKGLKQDDNSEEPIKKRKDVTPARRKNRAIKEVLEFKGDIDELTELINKRDFTWEYLNREAGFSAEYPRPLTQNDKKDRVDDFDDSYTRTGPNASVPFVIAKDEKLFKTSAREAYSQTPSSSSTQHEQYLHFGTGKSCKAIYNSAYEEPLYSSPHLYACKFCLYTTNLKEDLVVHWENCTATHPPGNEIYRDDVVSFFEVNGAVQKKYCQDLCLLAKLFIASKTLYEEVETFKFYVLCELTTEGFVIVGYFSKENNPSKNNNLSCLLVLPMVQKMGYGRLLIDMSYELSRRERKVGHPEHPLSDLGILAYRGYWRSSLLCYIRKHKNSERMSIKEIALATRITPVDIVNQLMLDNIINFKNGIYSIKISKRALKFPLSNCRRRCIDTTKLAWQPTNVDELDPNKLNSFIQPIKNGTS